ncbi:MAG: hypothetical protein M3081_12620 [Gemmatimonadota bacterium]|nr:hypothetical protein [Gemmatimonadota bacterium]
MASCLLATRPLVGQGLHLAVSGGIAFQAGNDTVSSHGPTFAAALIVPVRPTVAARLEAAWHHFSNPLAGIVTAPCRLGDPCLSGSGYVTDPLTISRVTVELLSHARESGLQLYLLAGGGVYRAALANRTVTSTGISAGVGIAGQRVWSGFSVEVRYHRLFGNPLCKDLLPLNLSVTF